MQVIQNSGCRGKFSAPPTSRLQCCSSSRFLRTAFSSSSDSNRTSPSLRRFRKRAALQRSFCTRCTWKRNCFQAHTPATGLARRSGLPSVTRDVLRGLAPPRGSLGGNAVFTSRRSVRVQWMTSSTFSLSQQDNKCLGAPSRESHTPQRTKKKSNRHSVAPRTPASWSVARKPTSPVTHTQNLRSGKTPPIMVRDQELHAAALPVAGPPKLPSRFQVPSPACSPHCYPSTEMTTFGVFQ